MKRVFISLLVLCFCYVGCTEQAATEQAATEQAATEQAATEQAAAEEKGRAEEKRKTREKLLLWEFATGDKISSSPTIGPDGTVYFGSFDNKVYALDGKTGAKKWEFETG